MKGKDPKDNFFRASKEIGEGKIKGYDFENPFDPKIFFDSFKDTGFQATNLGKAIDLVKKMRKEKATIYLGFTSNMSTCGVREAITYLAKNKLVDVIVTTTGGLEEDVIKVHKDFLHGDYDADGAKLRGDGVNRTGNIFIPSERYCWYEEFMHKVMDEVYSEFKKTSVIITSDRIIKEIGRKLESEKNKEESFVYWAIKNNIDLYCVPLHDGATGDHLYFYKKDHPDLIVDMVNDVEKMYDRLLVEEKVGAIIIGGSVPKHFIMNSCMVREGADYTVYINTGYEAEGSNAGANPEEAKSWGKAAHNDNNVKVWGEASIIFPILVAAAFKLK
ncbi:MAG: deoxyhypusine synthase [Candidatus ainarchaeum sp.]|jgi:deoxyhypusine synthase|nr:deoxyhypusine synthase [Candidatus ainarchaeum sp.]MDD4467646.1 deoxyhypusine synthase [Candidatus ainarchaeum sp.]